MATINVPSGSSIRAAIISGSTGDLISIADGTFDITFYNGVSNGGPPTFSYTALPNIFAITGFTPTTQWLGFAGTGNLGDPSVTTINGNPRLFVDNSDGSPPTKISFVGLNFSYTGASGYILQTGQFNTLTGATPSEIFLDNVSFVGTHAGAGSATSNPFGNYGAVLGFNKFTLQNSSVALTGQASFTGTSDTSGGSSFLMLQGGIGSGNSVQVLNNTFDESGYRNGVSVFDSKNVTISGTTFFRSAPATRYARTQIVSGNEVVNIGNKIANSQATVANNSFYDGSFLVLEKTVVDSTNVVTLGGSIGGNRFGQFNPSSSPIPNPIIGGATSGVGGGAVGVVLQGSQASSAMVSGPTTFANNSFSYVSPFVNLSSSLITLTGSNNSFVNPVNNLGQSVNRYVAGGTGNDNITTGSSNAEVFVCGLGSDTINTGFSSSNTDFVIFNTPIASGGDVDIITNFNAVNASTALDRIILDRKYFPGITATYNGTTASSIGAVNASNIENAAVATQASTRLLYVASTGTLSYDQDGSGSVYAPIPFARIYPSTVTTGAGISSIIGLNTAGTNLAAVNIGII